MKKETLYFKEADNREFYEERSKWIKCQCCNKPLFVFSDRYCHECLVSGKAKEHEDAFWRSMAICEDPIVESVRRKLLERSHTGIKKYGVTLYNSGLTRLQILRHAQEEALDLANYLETEIQRLEKCEQ